MKSKLAATLLTLALLSILNLQFSTADAQGTAFTYQGRLNVGGNPANGNYEFEFVLFPTNQFGFPVGPVPFTNAVVTNGLFTVTIDFGSGIFTGTNYWLDIFVRTNGAASFTELSPRQQLTPTPYAITAGSVVGNGAGLGNVNAATLGGLSRSNFWQLAGNAGASNAFIGTTDNQPFDARVNNIRVMRYQLNTDGTGSFSNAPNVIGGSPINTVATTNVGATIAGGGGVIIGGIFLPNTVTANFGTISGGSLNIASGEYATVGGGDNNIASENGATVGGGFNNVAGTLDGLGATVSGGLNNTASGQDATVPGGREDTASADCAFAAGQRAKAIHQSAFVWADSQAADFASTSRDQFLIRAQGGVGIGNNNPQAPLHVTGGGDANLSSGGNIISGLFSAQNIVIDNNEIISRNNGAASDLVLNFGSGNVGVGRAPAANRLEVGGEASKSTAGNWLANSDARIKTDVHTVTNALNKLSGVRLVQFRYTDDYRLTHPGVEDREYLNVVAQEFQKVFPEDVKRSGEKLANGDDILQVDTYPLTIYSAAAVQELNQRLDEKDAEIRKLKESVAELKEMVSQLAVRRQPDSHQAQ